MTPETATRTPRLPGIGAALAAAIRRINAIHNALPESDRPNVNGPRWTSLEAEIDAACAAGDADAALTAIGRYEGHAMRVLEEASR